MEPDFIIQMVPRAVPNPRKKKKPPGKKTDPESPLDPREAKKYRQNKYNKAKRDAENKFSILLHVSQQNRRGNYGSLPMMPKSDFFRNLATNFDLPVLQSCNMALPYAEIVHDGGCMGMFPSDLMYNLIHEVRLKSERQLNKLHWVPIASAREANRVPNRIANNCPNVPRKVEYYRFQWGMSPSGNDRSAVTPVDWRKLTGPSTNTSLLSVLTSEYIDRFACEIIKRVWPETKEMTISELKREYMIEPSMIRTVSPYAQAPHRDFPTEEMGTTVVVHAPMTWDGLLLQIWEEPSEGGDEDSSEVLGRPLFVPFGGFVALPVEAIHGGCFGSRGNLRFHMSIRKILTNNIGERPMLDNSPSLSRYRSLALLEQDPRSALRTYSKDQVTGERLFGDFSASYKSLLDVACRVVLPQTSFGLTL